MRKVVKNFAMFKANLPVRTRFFSKVAKATIRARFSNLALFFLFPSLSVEGFVYPVANAVLCNGASIVICVSSREMPGGYLANDCR
jgi:hypothetical protein